MKLRFECGEQACPGLIEYRPCGRSEESIVCPRCRHEHVARGTGLLLAGEPITQCALCGGQEFFIRKNFPQKTGLLIVAVAMVISFYSLKDNPGLAYGILAGAVLVDLLIYGFIGIVTVCYRCRAEYWGLRRNKGHDWFDLPTSEKYL